MSGDAIEAVSWGELLDDARRLAGVLTSRGIGPGAHVALIGTTSRGLTTSIQATWLTGATVMVLPLPMRLGSHAPIRAQVATKVREAVGLPTDDVVLVLPGSLPKTSSGKLQRSLCRTRYQDDELEPV